MKRGLIIAFFAAGLSGQTIQDTSPRTLVNAPYAKLTAMPNGTVLYCTDCTSTSPTTAGGTGAVVSRENGVWNGGGGGGHISFTRYLPVAVNDYVNIGTWTDTQSGGVHIELDCSAGGGLPSHSWTADTRYGEGGGVWMMLGGLGTNGLYPPNTDDYVAEIGYVGGFTTLSLRLRRIVSSSLGGQTLFCKLLGYGSVDSAFTPSTATGTETSPTPYYTTSSFVTQQAQVQNIHGKINVNDVPFVQDTPPNDPAVFLNGTGHYSGTASSANGTAGDVQVNSGSGFGVVSGFRYTAGVLGMPPFSSTIPHALMGGGQDARAIDILIGHDDVGANPVFSDVSGLLMNLNVWAGQNDASNAAKRTISTIKANSQYPASGQRQGIAIGLYSYGLGDVQAASINAYCGGGSNSSGDEGCSSVRAEAIGGSYQEAPHTVTSVPPQTSCSTTITADANPNSETPQPVAVASTTGCNVGDVVIVDRSTWPTNAEAWDIFAVNPGVSITVKVMRAHPSGTKVTPSTHLILDGTYGIGQDRLVIRQKSSGAGYYGTGNVTAWAPSGVVGNASAFTGTGTAWTPTIVGGDALSPCAISLAVDDTSQSGFATYSSWYECRSIDSGTSLTVGGYLPYRGTAGPTGTYAYTMNCSSRVMKVPWTGPFTYGVDVYLETPPSVCGWQAGDSIYQPVTTDHLSAQAINAVILPSIVQPGAFTGVQSTNASGISAGAAFYGRGSPDLFGHTAGAWNSGLTVTGPVGTGIFFQEVIGNLISLGTFPGQPACIHWEGAANAEFCPGTDTGVIKLQSKTGNINVKAPDGSAFTPNYTLDATRLNPNVPRTYYLPDKSGIVNLGGPGPLFRTLPVAVNDYVYIGSWLDTQTGGVHIELSCNAGGQFPGKSWVADTRYDVTQGAWRLLGGGGTNGNSGTPDDYVAEVRESGFNLDLRLRRTGSAVGGAQPLACNLLGYGAYDSAFTPSLTTGTEAAPSTTYLSGSMISQSGDTATINGKLALASVAAYTCNAATRGQFNYIAGAAGVKDTVQVCAKDSSDAYAWRPIY